MHIEILVEDQSGNKAIDILMKKILDNEHTFKIHSYKGIGRIPRNLKSKTDANKRILLDQLPRLLHGYGKAFSNYPDEYKAAVIVVCDLDDKCLKEFRDELHEILSTCNPIPVTRFCIAIEEGEAWLLGDIPALKKAYPHAKDTVLNAYENDTVCGTWELLANAVYPGGSDALTKKGWHAIGFEKYQWAERICPHMDVNGNKSPSFIYFREKLKELTES
ncbi:MAG: DUF4276 family protein [Candidatus Thiodiazotropha weberae]|nr:DUF4276 family protein [Candidatus Thiodiazotropha weberae]